jgi:non-ribosomal peptide synthetase-like protein
MIQTSISASEDTSPVPNDSGIASAILYGSYRPDLLRTEVLADIFEETALRFPEKNAVQFGQRSLSYQEFNQQADLAASALIRAGAAAGKIIGLWLPRGIELLIMQLAITKTGAAWLPFDADTPAERIDVCLKDANAIGLITDTPLVDLLNIENVKNIDHPALYHVWRANKLLQPTDLPLLRRVHVSVADPAYVIYTSGSTGKPKGITITQRSICHFLRSENSVLGIQSTDRVYQGFSVAFDMSFEEIWISYLVGASLWMAHKDLALDPDALPLALAQNQITVLHAVPTLLALFQQDIPSLRLINLGGEACPDALVARWKTAQRRLFNTYGPTEATVSASIAELQIDEAVTIGVPLPNYGLLVIASETEFVHEHGLRLLPRGEIGELCIVGSGLAAGYLGRADLTAEKFLLNPWRNVGAKHIENIEHRLYRTGDLARINDNGTVQCLGRADDQVKIRGFRVELGEIEARLAACNGVATVAVVLRRNYDSDVDQLVAFIVAEQGHEADLNSSELRHYLAGALPPYMLPNRYELLSEMPRLASGKIDRKVLKEKPLSTSSPSTESDIAATPAEALLFSILAKLFPQQAIRRDADFFTDLGGHSLLAARLVSALRADAGFAYFKISDIYTCRNIGKIADLLVASVPPSPSNDAAAQWLSPPAWKRWLCGTAQAITIPWLVVIRMLQWLAPFFVYHFFTGDPGDSILKAITYSVLAFILLTLGEFFIAILGKWMIIGRLKPGNYPLWGWTYYRWWLMDRLIESTPVYMLSGSSLHVWWLRALGAKVGRDVNLGSMTLRVPDLFEIGDRVSTGNACNFENARVEHGLLRLGTIKLGNDACIGSYAVLEGNVTVGQFGHLEGQSALSEGQVLPAYRIWKGSPAQDVGHFDHSAQLARPNVSEMRLFGEGVFFLIGSLFIAALFFLPVFPSFVAIDLIDEAFPWVQGNSIPFQLAKYFLLAFPATAILIICTALVSAGIRWGILPKLRPGSYPVHSRVYCSKWLVNQIQEASLYVLHGVYATVFAPFWYRLLGAKVGKGAEISTALGVVPDMLTLGDETFIADAVLLGDEQIDGGWMTMHPTVVSRRSFVGNGAYIPDGTILPENVLIGVHSSAPANTRMQNGDTWLGSPPIHLPAREETTGFPEALTFHPSMARRLGRSLIELFRIIAPHAMVIAVGYTIVLDLMPLAGDDRWLEVVFDLALSGLLYGVGCFIFVLVLKWTLIFRYKKHSAPMWTRFVWVSEAITNLFEGVAVPNFMRYLRGTPWLPIAFNLLGCKIGRGVYLDTTDLTEFDCVSIGDFSELNALTCPQTHLFEDRVMKVDHVIIGQRVYMGPRSAILYGAEVGHDAKLGALTLVMKGEFIPANSHWRGCPASIAENI